MEKDNWISDLYKKSIYENSSYLNVKSYDDLKDIFNGYKYNEKWSTYKSKREETREEREFRLLREKATLRSNKIDLILKK